MNAQQRGDLALAETVAQAQAEDQHLVVGQVRQPVAGGGRNSSCQRPSPSLGSGRSRSSRSSSGKRLHSLCWRSSERCLF